MSHCIYFNTERERERERFHLRGVGVESTLRLTHVSSRALLHWPLCRLQSHLQGGKHQKCQREALEDDVCLESWTAVWDRRMFPFLLGCQELVPAQRQAYLADVVPSERLPRFMVFREASATLAFIIGPTVGGYLTKDRAKQIDSCWHIIPLVKWNKSEKGIHSSFWEQRPRVPVWYWLLTLKKSKPIRNASQLWHWYSTLVVIVSWWTKNRTLW